MVEQEKTQKIEKLKEMRGDSDLRDDVINWALESSNDDEDLEMLFKDLAQGGCQSGMVGDLVHYDQTIDFYEKHEREIDEMLSFVVEELGSPQEVFGDKWDKEDPLAKDFLNQNLLAWFGFEETAHKIMDELDIED